MKFSKLVFLAIIGSLVFSASVSARTVYPVLDKRGNPVQDKNGNCVRSTWLAEQCCDPCGFPAPPAPEPITQVVQKEKKIPYADLVRQSIYFEIDKDNIDETDIKRMEDVINEITKSVAIRDIKLVGYADRFATNKYNIDLSKRRATHVLDYFRSRGFFGGNNIGFGYFGEEKPVTTCPMDVPIIKQIACLQADRRVDIEVELLRERVETYKETITLPPAYPRPGTEGVEVYSHPIDPRALNFEENKATQPAINIQAPQGK